MQLTILTGTIEKKRALCVLGGVLGVVEGLLLTWLSMKKREFLPSSSHSISTTNKSCAILQPLHSHHVLAVLALPSPFLCVSKFYALLFINSCCVAWPACWGTAFDTRNEVQQTFLFSVLFSERKDTSNAFPAL